MAMLRPTALTIGGSARNGAMEQSSWRPPWFDTMNSVDAAVLRGEGIRSRGKALDYDRTAPALPDELNVLPRQLVAICERALKLAR